MNKKLKYILVFILLITSVAYSVNYFIFSANKTELAFTTDFVKKGDIENIVLTNGVLYPYKLVDVGSQAAGQIQNIAVNLGDEVKQGDLIAQLDSLNQQNALKEAQASLNIINAQYRAKQAQIREAASEFKRQQKMLSDGASSQSAYDSAATTLMVYEAELEQLKAQKEQSLISVDNAKIDLGYTTISAPIDGTIVYISVEEGQTLSDNQDIPTIVEIAQLNTMTVKAEVSEADVIHITPGQEVYFSILGAPKQKYWGVLRAIEPGPTLMTGDDSKLTIGDSDAIYYNALFDIENPERLLRFGMTTQVSIILDKAQDTLLVPAQVLIEKPHHQGYQVALLKQGKEVYQDVEVGINNKIYAQILSGLQQGDEIIIGQASLADNAKSNLQGPGSRQQQMRF